MSSFGFERAEDSPGFLLWQLSAMWQRRVKKALDTHGISHPQFVVMAITLWFMENNLELTQAKIIQMSKLDPMTVSNVAQKLEQLKYLKRSESQTDPRAKSLTLTSLGVQRVQELIPLVEGVDRECFDKLDSVEQKELIRLFQKLSRN